MTDNPKEQAKEPAPRPPRQPDPKLITYLERAQEPRELETRTEPKQGD